jgi:hypothetical protein
MILENKKATVSYRCPCCGKAVLGMVGAFNLSADMLKIKCECGGSEMVLTTSSEGKIRLTFPCIVCPNPHTYLISKNILFSDNIFIIPCSYSGIDIAFLGNHEKVSDALEKQAETLNNLLEASGLTTFEQLKEDESWEDTAFSQVEDVIRFMLCELDDEGKIKCLCKERGDIPYYNFQVLSQRVRIFCECCNSDLELPLGCVTDAEQFIRIDNLELK